MRLVDARDGWPGHIKLHLSTGWVDCSVHIGPVHSMSRGPHEFRFQNPGQNRPVRTLPNTIPLLIGVWDTDTPHVLVAAQPEQRLGDMTRFSVLFLDRLFREAQQVGWADPYRNNTGGLHWSFFPQLLPIFVEYYQSQIDLDPDDVRLAVVGAGLVDNPTPASARRARHATTRLIRDARFAKAVVEAYDRKCSMCGLNLGLVSGAHILPVSAPNSTDQATNGLALCENHHRAFDRHSLWVHPTSRRIKIHPRIIAHAQGDAVSKAFVDGILPALREPVETTLRPLKERFDERYAYFEDDYDWAT